MKTLVKQTLLHFGIRAYGPGSLPKGIDLFHDLHRFHLADSIESIVDVGANIGDFSLEAHHALPGRRIIAFEPTSNTFKELQSNLASYPNITPCQAALGSQPGHASIEVHESSRFNSLLSARSHDLNSNVKMETVIIKTLDEVIGDFGLNAIDFLKTDTEGFDFEVLKGAGSLLSKGAIKLILCEVTFHNNDKQHTSFSKVWELLQDMGFDLFAFYNQSRFRERGALDYCDALFINTRQIPVK